MRRSSLSGTSASPKAPSFTLLRGNIKRAKAFRGEFVMIRGPSGGGKTTLLNLIGTIDSPSDGEL